MKKLEKKMILFLVNHFLVGTHAFELKRKLLNLVTDINLGVGTKVVGPLYIYGALDVGNATWIGHDFTVEGNGRVSIGNNCDIAPGVVCLTGSHQIGIHERRAGEGITGPIQIGNGTWIGAGAKILLDHRIGDGVIIASGALVTDDVDDDCLVGGIPAKVIRRI